MAKNKNRHFLIGIDTAFDRRFSYLAFGPTGTINQLKNDIEQICLRNGVRKIHFNDIDPDKRSKIYPYIVEAVLRHNNVTYNVLQHTRPLEYPKKQFYLNFLPEEYAKLFMFLKVKSGIIRVDIHDDFSFTGVKDCTSHLLESLMKKISRNLSGQPDTSKLNVFRRDGDVFFKVKCKDTDCILSFNLRKSIGQASNAIIVADMILGFHQLKFKTKNKLLPQTRYDNEFLRKVFYKNITP